MSQQILLEKLKELIESWMSLSTQRKGYYDKKFEDGKCIAYENCARDLKMVIKLIEPHLESGPISDYFTGL
jgi:hypothetical protein